MHPPAIPLGLVDHVLDPISGNDIWSMGLRTLVIYSFALFLVRAGKSRMFGKATAFDIVITFILGSTLSRAINGNAPLIPSLVASGVLVLAHWLLGFMTYHSDTVGRIIKGRADRIVEDGEVLRDSLHKHHLSEHDLEEALRLHGIDDMQDIKVAFFERNGDISVIRRSKRVRASDLGDG